MHAVIDHTGTNWIAEHRDLSHDWRLRFDGTDGDKATVFLTDAQVIDLAKRLAYVASRAKLRNTYCGMPLKVKRRDRI